MSLLCKLGFHKWRGHGKEVTRYKSIYNVSTQASYSWTEPVSEFRRCTRMHCGKKQKFIDNKYMNIE